ncbi:hypothetical protein DHODJN_26005 [Methylorubrum extorquens]
MFLIMFAAITASLLTIFVMASDKLLLALMAGPLVGSAAGLCVALFLAWKRGSEWKSDYDLDQQTDTVVSPLRSAAEQGPAVDAAPTIGRPSLRRLLNKQMQEAGTLRSLE